MSKNSNNGCLLALLIILLCPWLIVAVPVLFGLIMGLFGVGMGLLGTGIGLFAILPGVLSTFLSAGWVSLILISLPVAIILPIAFLIYAVIRLIWGNGLPKWQTWLIVILIWVLSLVGIAATGVKAIREAGGIEALHEQLASQSQSWEYSWSNVDENDNDNDNENDNEN